MLEKERTIGQKIEVSQVGVFDNPPESAPKAVIAFLQLAEQEGAYATLSEATRQRLEMRFLLGVKISEIAGLQDVSKQAVSQTIKTFPKMLYGKMENDVFLKTTTISYREIFLKYSECLLYFQEQNKPIPEESPYINLAIGE